MIMSTGTTYRQSGGAILFDFDRSNGVYPDKALARGDAAARWTWSARPRRRAQCPRWQGFARPIFETGGQGAAVDRIGAASVLAVTVTNALGAIVDRTGNVVRGHRVPPPVGAIIFTLGQGLGNARARQGHTTPTLLITNQKVSPYALRQLARQAHASMARAIEPFHTPFDGDVLLAISTGEVEEPRLADPSALGAVAAETIWTPCWKLLVAHGPIGRRRLRARSRRRRGRARRRPAR